MRSDGRGRLGPDQRGLKVKDIHYTVRVINLKKTCAAITLFPSTLYKNCPQPPPSSSSSSSSVNDLVSYFSEKTKVPGRGPLHSLEPKPAHLPSHPPDGYLTSPHPNPHGDENVLHGTTRLSWGSHLRSHLSVTRSTSVCSTSVSQ